MPSDIFWKMTPKMFMRQLPFYEKQLEVSRRAEQNLAWIQGIYVARAVGACFKGKYPEKPIDFYNLDNNDFTKDEEKDKPKRAKDVEAFEAWAIAFNKEKFGGNNTAEDESEVKEDG